MDRRKFLLNIPFFGFLFFRTKSVVGSPLSSLIQTINSSDSPDFLTIEIEKKAPIKIPIWWQKKLAYISTVKLAKSLHYHTYFNDTKRKIVLYLPQNRVVVTAKNAFVIVDEKAYQMPIQALWEKNEIYVPIKYFFPLIDRRTHINLIYNDKNQILKITQKDFNISEVSISAKNNGTVIRVKTAKYFKPEEITADMRYGWLHIDLYGGKADIEKIRTTQLEGLVRQIKTFQFPELASLAFLLRQEPLSKEITTNPDNNEVLVVLRTKEEISETDQTEIPKEDQIQESNQSINEQLEQERRKWLIDVVVIDPGHGGKDPGTIGIGKVQEKNIVLPIAQKLGNIIKKDMPGIKVIFTRTSDKFISLKRRTQIANENNGKIFISIHANSFKKKNVSGFETYILGPEKGEQARSVVLTENSVIDFEDANTRKEYQGINNILATMAQSAFSKQSEYLASLVQNGLNQQLRGLKMKNRGVKQGPFWVMVGATMPNILIETGYISNSYDVKILKTAAYQQKIAMGIFEGLKNFKRDYENAI